MENLNIREIVGTDLLDYSLKLEQAFKEGYSVSVSNDFAPRAIGYAMYAWVVKDTLHQVEGDTMSEEKRKELLDALSNTPSKVIEVPQNTSAKPAEKISEVSEGVGSQNEAEVITEASTQVVEDKPKATKRGRK